MILSIRHRFSAVLVLSTLFFGHAFAQFAVVPRRCLSSRGVAIRADGGGQPEADCRIERRRVNSSNHRGSPEWNNPTFFAVEARYPVSVSNA